MSGDGIRGLLNLAGASVMAPDKLSEAWSSFPEVVRANLGNGALERVTKVLEELKYNPNEEFATFAKDAGELVFRMFSVTCRQIWECGTSSPSEIS